jgi:hypothetical protein
MAERRGPPRLGHGFDFLRAATAFASNSLKHGFEGGAPEKRHKRRSAIEEAPLLRDAALLRESPGEASEKRHLR